MSEINIELVRERARKWQGDAFDKETQEEVKIILQGDEKILIDTFYKDLEFGTGGLRGIMGAGTNRMNRYTLGLATQGLSNYLLKTFGTKEEIKVAVGHDCRHNSRQFAEITADIFSSNGLRVYLFEDLRPTPELSFVLRHLDCKSGVIITASHNPPEYNGYKAYWDDGGQVTAPHDLNIIEEVRKLDITDIQFAPDKSRIEILGREIDDLFINEGKKYSINPENNRKFRELPIVYTPIHGTGVYLIPAALRAFGFTNIINVPEQDIIDGNFSTVDSPNPEEPAAFDMALNKAKATGAVLVMASDPDGDRLGAAVKNRQGEYILLNGNQTGLLLIWYIITQKKKKNQLGSKDYIIKTIVTSDLFDEVARLNNVRCYNVLTGFKYFASLMRILETKGERYIGGGEESFGFMPGDYVRDKDAVVSCALMAEVAAFAESKDLSLYDILIDIYAEYGLYKERLKYVVRKGVDGAKEIADMMKTYRDNPPEKIAGSAVTMINDYLKLEQRDLLTGTIKSLDFEESNVLQFILENGSKVSVRPSGTEPKIKFYFSVNSKLEDTSLFETKEEELELRIDLIIKDLGI
jgi:phosphoglucomutase